MNTYPSFVRIGSLLLAAVIMAGCATPKPGPISKFMQPAPPPASTPPPGKCLIVFHRPLGPVEAFYTAVWDSTNFIADLATGHSAAYVCDPGAHVFFSRYIMHVGVIEANLQPDQTYDLAMFKYFWVTPVKPGEKERELVPQWTKDAVWVTRGPRAAEYESLRKETTAKEIDAYTSGAKKKHLLHLAAEDHR
jgi:hypothetical protein